MKKVVVLGASGMLGHTLCRVLREESFHVNLTSYSRSTFEVRPRTLNQLGPILSKLCGFDTDYVINCIGAIKPTFDAAPTLDLPIYTNAVFPHQLATWAELTNTKMIHISTDCVFSGTEGLYTENSPHSALDTYGRSKSLGEPNSAMTLRTSIIGPEIGGRKRSLLEWIKLQGGKKIKGYTNHLWNGLTTLELSRMVMYVVEDEHWSPGVHHLFSEDVSKHELVEEIAHQYAIDVDIEPVEVESVDRTLRTVRPLNEELSPNSLNLMISQMREWDV